VVDSFTNSPGRPAWQNRLAKPKVLPPRLGLNLLGLDTPDFLYTYMYIHKQKAILYCSTLAETFGGSKTNKYRF
jgi:hypothetical protein